MIQPFDKNNDIAITKDPISFSKQYFIDLAKISIQTKGAFTVALSGGSTPKKLYNELKNLQDAIDWSKVFVFFSDERSVSPTDSDSNYHMAMENGFSSLPIPKGQIYRMVAENDIKENAKRYEQIIRENVKDTSFDLILLGMGDDGHTASLFPGTKALEEKSSLVVENEVPQKDTVRMTFTYPLLAKARNIMFLATGENKAQMVEKVLNDKSGKYPSSNVICNHNKVLWVLDEGSAKNL